MSSLLSLSLSLLYASREEKKIWRKQSWREISSVASWAEWHLYTQFDFIKLLFRDCEKTQVADKTSLSHDSTAEKWGIIRDTLIFTLADIRIIVFLFSFFFSFHIRIINVDTEKKNLILQPDSGVLYMYTENGKTPDMMILHVSTHQTDNIYIYVFADGNHAQ